MNEQRSGVGPPRILLDECIPVRLRRELPGLDVSHVVVKGWAGRRNGALFLLMREAGFAVLVTVDRNLALQQNVGASGIAVVVLHARSNRIDALRPLIGALRDALAVAEPGQVVHLGV